MLSHTYYFPGIGALAGNVSVVIWSIKNVFLPKKKNRQSANEKLFRDLILNLSIADLLVGVSTFVSVSSVITVYERQVRINKLHQNMYFNT